MMICIGLRPGKISEVTEKQNTFFIKFESDDGYYDRLSFQEDSQQLKNLAKLLDKSVSPKNWVDTRVQLFLGPEVSVATKSVMAYGIAKENSNTFFVPEYIFNIIEYTPSERYYSYSEVAEILEHTEDVL